MREKNKKPAGIVTNPFFVITVACTVVFLAGEAFYSVVGRNLPPLPPSPPIAETTADWQLYANTSEGFSFRHPPVYGGPTAIRTDFVEAYDALYRLVILINTVNTRLAPTDWLRGETREGYSNKPYSCFSQRAVTDVPSVDNPKHIILHFDTPVLLLDNIASPESRQGLCANHPTVRILLIPHNQKIIRVIYRESAISETTVSTFRLLESSAQEQ